MKTQINPSSKRKAVFFVSLITDKKEKPLKLSDFGYVPSKLNKV